MTANVTDFQMISSFHDYQFDAIISAIEVAEIPYQLEFFDYRGGAFNLFVAKQYIDKVVEITTKIETGETVYNTPLAIAKYHTAKSKV
jgi:hypothetical protein